MLESVENTEFFIDGKTGRLITAGEVLLMIMIKERKNVPL